MGEEMAQSDLVPSWEIRNVLGQFIVDAELSLLLQFQNRRGGELLGD